MRKTDQEEDESVAAENKLQVQGKLEQEHEVEAAGGEGLALEGGLGRVQSRERNERRRAVRGRGGLMAEENSEERRVAHENLLQVQLYIYSY